MRRARTAPRCSWTRLLTLAAAMAASGALSASPALPAPPAGLGAWAEGRILVAPRTGITDAQLGEALKSHGGRSLGKIGR